MKFKEEMLCQSGLCKKTATVFIAVTEKGKEELDCKFCKEHYEEYDSHCKVYFEGDFEPKKYGIDEDDD